MFCRDVVGEKRQPVIKLSLRPRAAEERTDVFSDFLRLLVDPL